LATEQTIYPGFDEAFWPRLELMQAWDETRYGVKEDWWNLLWRVRNTPPIEVVAFSQNGATMRFEVTAMQVIDLQTTGDKFLISVDKRLVGKEFMLNLVERIRLEYLAQKVDFDGDMESLGEEIKAGWWEKNKARFID
jgi:hypothetical protein